MFNCHPVVGAVKSLDITMTPAFDLMKGGSDGPRAKSDCLLIRLPVHTIEVGAIVYVRHIAGDVSQQVIAIRPHYFDFQPIPAKFQKLYSMPCLEAYAIIQKFVVRGIACPAKIYIGWKLDPSTARMPDFPAHQILHTRLRSRHGCSQ